MVPKTILVCLTTREHAATLMKVAVPLARRTGAHLVGLHAADPDRFSAPDIGPA